MILDKITNKFQLRLKDRTTAANILGEALKDVIKGEEERKKSVVLGIPGGGVVIADIIARKLACQFDIVIPRKLRASHNEELAIGAAMEDGTNYLNDDIIGTLRISEEYIGREKFLINNKFNDYNNNIQCLLYTQTIDITHI